MKHRDQLLEDHFLNLLRHSQFPACKAHSPLPSGFHNSQLTEIFESQLYSRHVDLLGRRWRRENKGFYTISSSGHEGNAVLAALTRTTDPALLHYRSGAFQVHRSRSGNPAFLEDMLLSLRASSREPVSGGRHKVIGSKKDWIIPQTSTVGSHLPRAVGLARSIPLSKKLRVSAPLPLDSIVICSFGDASFNHSTAQGALNLANWLSFQSIPLPILFLCEDNGLGISVPTPKGWIQTSASSYSSIRYFHCDGLCLSDLLHTGSQAVDWVRERQRPAFLHINTVRLLAHAGSDIESTYRTQRQIELDETRDPLLHSASILINHGLMSAAEILELYQSIGEEVRKIGEELADTAPLRTAKEVIKPIIPTVHASSSSFCFERLQGDGKKHPMGKLINLALHETLQTLEQSVLFGEDVGTKGGVYNISAGLQKRFSRRRIFDSILDEQSILGFALGLSLNGFLPIPEIQFLAYLHNAEDQLRGEAATLSFFSNSQFANPMVVRIPGLAYQKGFGGHFHNDNSLAVLRDIPGIVLVCPSNGEDAVKLFRSAVRLAYEQRRVVVFLEPIALYHTRDLHSVGDQLYCFEYPSQAAEAAPFEVKIHGDGEDIAILSYGNGVYFALQAQESLKGSGIQARVIDIQWLSPLPVARILDELGACQRICIVDECRKTGSLSEELYTRLHEESHIPLKMERLCSMDSFIPLGNASTLVLVSKDDIIHTCKNLMR